VSAQYPRFRPVLDRFAPYKPGKTVPSGPGGRSFKLSSNESPFGPLPSVAKVIAEAAASVNRYPDDASSALIEAIAARWAVPPSHVTVGCGAVGLTQQLLETVGEPGAEVVYAWRSFECYPTLSDLAGVTSVRVPLHDATHDLAAMADAITDDTRLVFVCNPNNPTGTVVQRRELEDFLDRVPPDCLVVLDEAYGEYVRDAGVSCGIGLYPGRPNLAVLRSFSKAYGLAGLRVGYLIAHEPVAAVVRKTKLPFTVNALAQAAAIASLEAEDELMERVDQVVGERERVRAELITQGWAVPPTQANFVWLATGEDTPDFTATCERAGIAVRPYATDGVRVSVGDWEANDAFLAVASAYPRRL
jgi:histidinol-phosphate aminotransferase